jgi:hypothetical protein
MRRAAALVAVSLGFLSTSCQTSRNEEATSQPLESPVLHIVATDDGHQSPDSVLAGLRHVRFENHGTMIHEAMFVRLPDGMTGAEYSAAVAAGNAFPEGALDYSGPGLTSPGESLDMWVELDPGRYALVCWYRHPAKDGTHPQHVTQGPLREFMVSAQAHSDSAPSADATLRLIDFHFQLDRDIKAGMRTVRVEMAGPSMHEMDVYRLGEGHELDDLRAWYKSGRKTPPPGTVLGGVLDSHAPGRTVWLRREFLPGRYVAWCGMDMPNEPGAKTVTHADMGMVLEFTVAE